MQISGLYKFNFSIKGNIVVREACDNGVLHRIKGIDLDLQELGFWYWKEGKERLTLVHAHSVLTGSTPHPPPICCSFLSLLNFILYYRQASVHGKMTTFSTLPPLHMPSYASSTWPQGQGYSSSDSKSRNPREELLGQEMLTKERRWEILLGKQITIVTVVYYINYSQSYFGKGSSERLVTLPKSLKSVKIETPKTLNNKI